MSKSKKSGNGLLTLVGFLIGLLSLLLIFRKKTSSGNASIDIRIREELEKNGFLFGDYFAKVARLETGNYTSRLFKEQNNLFGMRDASRRPNCQEGVANGFGVYKSISDSICDLVDYLKYFNYPKSFANLAEFVAFMKSKGYFVESESSYLNALKGL